MAKYSRGEVPRRTERRPVYHDTGQRRELAEQDLEHDYDDHLDAVQRGIYVDCFCVRSPYVRPYSPNPDRSPRKEDQ